MNKYDFLIKIIYEQLIEVMGKCFLISGKSWDFLVVSGLRICLPRASLAARVVKNLPANAKGTWVLSLAHGRNLYRASQAHVPQLLSLCFRAQNHNYGAIELQLLKPTHPKPVLSKERDHCNEKPPHSNQLEKPHCIQLEKPMWQRRPNIANK